MQTPDIFRQRPREFTAQTFAEIITEAYTFIRRTSNSKGGNEMEEVMMSQKFGKHIQNLNKQR